MDQKGPTQLPPGVIDQVQVQRGGGAVALRCADATCTSCGHQAGGVSVLQARSTGTGWKVGGRAEWPARAQCATCGMTYQVLQTVIPVELGAFRCEHCDKSEHIKVAVVGIEEVATGVYEFVATARCAVCEKVSIARRVLNALRTITRVKVGADGIEFERAAP